MLYITGDTHGKQAEWKEHIEPVLHRGDIIIVNGDFGVGFWYGSRSEDEFYDFISTQEYTVLFLDGNHENFDKLNSYPVETWCGGKVHKIRHNLIHLMRGEVYDIEGNSVFVMGGGYSSDKYRRTQGVSWWAEEMPSEEEYSNAVANLERVNNRVDYIITHTAPSDTVYYLSMRSSLGIKDNGAEELPLNIFLDDIQRKVTYRHWYFGHFHVDLELWRNQTAVFNEVRKLTVEGIVRQ